MNDCSNVEVREALPDLLHGRLDEITRRRVSSHLEECADCREELALLRDVRAALAARAPGIDGQRIVGAIAPYRTPSRAFRWWRVAAAAAVLLVGGGTVGVLSRTGGRPGRVDTVAAMTATSPELSVSGGLGDLDEADLKAILPEIDRLNAVPSSDPEPIGLSLGSAAPSSGVE